MPADYKNLFENVDLDENDIAYVKAVVGAYELNHEIIDQAIELSSANWKLSRMPRADLSIMRLAICEMMYCNDVPARVAINEAINLSKRYCEDDSASFINGVLDGCMKKL
jgi:N utilization substance protein B